MVESVLVLSSYNALAAVINVTASGDCFEYRRCHGICDAPVTDSINGGGTITNRFRWKRCRALHEREREGGGGGVALTGDALVPHSCPLQNPIFSVFHINRIRVKMPRHYFPSVEMVVEEIIGLSELKKTMKERRRVRLIDGCIFFSICLFVCLFFS